MNNKGFASTFILFGLLVLFLLVVSILMVTINNSASLNNTLKNKIIDDLKVSKKVEETNPIVIPTYSKYYYYENGQQEATSIEGKNIDIFIGQKANEEVQVCGVYSNAVACLDPDTNGDLWDCGEDDNNVCTNTTGYIASKKQEFTSAGANCKIENSRLSCSSNKIECYITSSGDTSCIMKNAPQGCYVNGWGGYACESYE